MEMSLFRLVFYGIPENIALVTLAFAIAKAKFEWKKIVLMGLLMALTAYALRRIPITFGVHTIVCLGLLIFLLSYFAGVDLTRSITSVLITYIILALVETISRSITLELLNWSIEEVTKNELLITLTGLPEVVILFIIAFMIKKYIVKDNK
jgi:energy-coupling factor transporter transmembrane protein EcfT